MEIQSLSDYMKSEIMKCLYFMVKSICLNMYYRYTPREPERRKRRRQENEDDHLDGGDDDDDDVGADDVGGDNEMEDGADSLRYPS